MKETLQAISLTLLFFSMTIPITHSIVLSTPTVEITWPENNYETTEKVITLLGYTTGDYPIVEYGYTITYPGGDVFSEYWELDTPMEYYEFEIDITLADGADGNFIEVYSENSQNEKGSDAVTVFYIPDQDDTVNPEIIISYPENNQIYSDPDTIFKGSISDNVGVTSVRFYQLWDEGETEIFAEDFTDPKPDYPFYFDVQLKPGNNSFLAMAVDGAGNSNQSNVTVIYEEEEEGLYIDSQFQPVQVVYPDDPLYGNDVSGGPCNWDAGLDMIAGKNTYIFGYPYSNRKMLDITVCNNYDEDKTFSFVFKITSESPLPEDEEIWRSDPVSVPRKSVRTFSYQTPIPWDGPFQWNWWGVWSEMVKTGSVVLTIDPDVTGGSSSCNCAKVTCGVNVRATHDLDVLFIPITFGNGPDFPDELDWLYGDFKQWLREDLKPWWKAIYPIREEGISLGTCYWYQKRNFTIDGVTVSDLESLDDLTNPQKQQIFIQLVTGSIPSHWLHECSNVETQYDRIVWLMHPDLIGYNGRNREGFMFTHIKRGGFVKWDLRNPVSAHEITHTYGIEDNYELTGGNLTYNGDSAVGYWVNENKDVTNSRDLMGALWRQWDIREYVWLKKPNYKLLIDAFNKPLPDPEVLGISGLIHSDNSVDLLPFYQLDIGTIDHEWGRDGDYLIKAFDENNNIIYQTGFFTNYTQINDFIEDEELTSSIFSFRVPYDTDIKKISIYKNNSNDELASRTKSSHYPTVEITEPSNAGRIRKEKFEIKWDAHDSDGDSLTFNLLASNNSGETWWPIAFDEKGNACTVDFRNTGQGDYQIRIYVTDGWNVAEDTIGFNVKNSKNVNILFSRIMEKYPVIYEIIRRIIY